MEDKNLIESIDGLSEVKASELLQKFGPNEIVDNKRKPFIIFLHWFISPITLMLLTAGGFSLFLNQVFNASFILFLVLLNYSINRWQEHKADNAINKLREHLTVKVSVNRDGSWTMIDSRNLVPGDIVRLFRGNLIPADAKIIRSNSLIVNQSMITGESLPLDRKVDDELYSGSFVVSGEAEIEITKTGSETHFGEAINMVDTKSKKSLLEKDIFLITRFLTFISIFAVIVLSGYFLIKGFSISELILLDLSLMIAGIPIALPTVTALILHVGALRLTEKKVVIRRLSALDDLANVTLLLTDKTGTLTKNEISVNTIIPWGNYSEQEIVKYAFLAGDKDENDSIDEAIKTKAGEIFVDTSNIEIIKTIFADSNRKRVTVILKENGEVSTISNGAPQVIIELCNLSVEEKKKFNQTVEDMAKNGFRVLAVAKVSGQDEKGMQLLGLITLTDPLIDDAKEVISFLKSHGIAVKMQTGDNRAIAAYIADRLSLIGEISGREEVENLSKNSSLLQKIAVFSEILPEDKLKIVEAGEMDHVVAVTGDGANDIPAIKAANIGIAVHNAVDALKSTADVVLLSDGISVIKDAFIEARKVFARIYSYSVYRISESFRLIATIFILGIAIQAYPLTPIQLILIAFLNDLPIISLAFNRVNYVVRPEGIKVRERFILSLLFGVTGVFQSLILFFILKYIGLATDIIQTAFFLKLVISGHMLVFVAHTKKHWWKYLPAKTVIIATSTTAVVASLLAYFGLFMTPISLKLLIFVWVWALIWMQISELVKTIRHKYLKEKTVSVAVS